jgi:hypothetical protein
MDEQVTSICKLQVEFAYHEDEGSKALRKVVYLCELKQRHFTEDLKIHDHNRKTLKSEMFRQIRIV